VPLVVRGRIIGNLSITSPTPNAYGPHEATLALYGISLYTEAADRALAACDTAPVATNLQEIDATTREALAETRLLLFELRPPLLKEQGLAAALRTRLEAVEARAGLDVSFESDGQERLHWTRSRSCSDSLRRP
jgi:signal transduction histidine kinase